MYVLIISLALSIPIVLSISDASGGNKSSLSNLETLAIAKDSTQHFLTSPLLYTEGGAQNSNFTKTKLATATETKAILPLLGNESGSRKSSIKPRKGVQKEVEVKSLNTTDSETVAPSKDNSTDFKHPQVNKTGNAVVRNTTSSSIKNTTSSAIKNTTNPTINNKTSEPIPKKPLILSGDQLESATVPKDKVAKVRSHLTVPTSSSRPDLVIPITITVFALPLFAVLGYYALKHGREAWKNRHYRRMDFLLDGMYNE